MKMKTSHVFSLLGLVCLTLAPAVQSQGPQGCILGDMMMLDQPDFPDIEKKSMESYQMTVEFTIKGAKQTDYYTEFYDVALGRGRVDGHQGGRNLKYIYMQDSWESWNIEGDTCNLQNITDTPGIFRDYQTDWVYVPDEENPNERTVGPSAMFKMALKRWKSGNSIETRNMAYLGELHGPIRGIRAQAWRWCQEPTTSVDFFFTVNETDNAYNMKSMNVVPLRVTFNGNWTGDQKILSEQYYDIMNFQPYISLGLHPFQIPKGKNCRRSPLYPPKLPDFSTGNMMFSAEVLYRKVKGKEDTLSFYSNLMFAIDRESKLMGYYYSPWNTTKTKDSDGKDITNFEVAAPEFVIYDMEYNYTYTVDFETGQCVIGRSPSFDPVYKLPQNAGNISLADPYLLFPNDELTYLTRSQERGIDVDIFEAYLEGFVMGETAVSKAIITHSYLKEGEIMENEVEIKNAPTQIEIHLFRTTGVEEILTFNFFGFSTRLWNKRGMFDISRCFKNDDDYAWVTLGFEPADEKGIDLTAVPIRQIQRDIVSYLDIDVSLKPTRVPFIMVDARQDLYVTLLLLEKPPVQLDFTDVEEGKSIDSKDVKGLATYADCATACLEEKKGCWGFSLCGGQEGECFFATSPTDNVVEKKGCILHRRYNNETYLRSKEAVLQDLQSQVNMGNVKLTLNIKDQEVKVKATSIDITDPAEDDSTFRRLGNQLNPRMRSLKVGAKLKKGSSVKSLGKLQFAECQKLCLDFQDCETVSFCMINSDCVTSTKYGDEIKPEDTETDLVCQMVTRKYADNFDRSPGLFLEVDASKTLDLDKTEDCARACLKETSFKCLSFDHCPQESNGQCRLHKVHFLNKNAKKESLNAKPTCGHYSRKYSTTFKKSAESHVVGSTLPPITNLTLEECAKTCVEYTNGACYGYDFCQGSTIGATSCILLDSDPSRMETVYSAVCSNYVRTEAEYAPRPYSTSYAGGIGFLCFLIGGIVGAVVVFAIAYFKVNRR